MSHISVSWCLLFRGGGHPTEGEIVHNLNSARGAILSRESWLAENVGVDLAEKWRNEIKMGVYVAKWILQQPEIQTRYETWLRDKGNWGDVGASLKKWYEFCDNHDIAYDRQGS